MMIAFTHPDLLDAAPFAPHAYAELKGAFPEGAIPEPAYDTMCRKYAAITDVRVRRILYQSDELRVSGLMAEPVEMTADAHPILIYNRGGNRRYGMLTVRAALNAMIPFAEQGYLVFASNYRGVEGGDGLEEFGGADVDDVLNLLKLAEYHPGWDGKNRFMTGHSRGGMMTYRAIASGAPLNAAISIAGIADLVAGGKERPKMQENVYTKLVPHQSPEELEEALKRRSAVNWPEKLNVPLLFLHGDADPRVDISHSRHLYEAMQRAGKICKLVEYPGGNHALLRHWNEVLAESSTWMEQYRT